MIDEYNTTKKCNVCHCETQKVKCWKEVMIDGERSLKLVEAYGLRRCSNNECRITWDRDLNACPNIMIVLLSDLRGLERPEYLCREKKQE